MSLIKETSTQHFSTEQWQATQTSPLPIANSENPPTISDELRWSLQTAVRPLEAAAQMCAAIHGITTNEPAEVQQIVRQVVEKHTNERVLASKTSVGQIALQSQSVFSLINRLNTLTLEQMGAPLLRMYVSEMAAVHPAVLQYMRDNEATFTYFKPVSETIGLTYTVVADIACSDLSDWCTTNVLRTQPNNGAAALRSTTYNKIFPEIGQMLETANALCNGYIIRSIPRNSACKIDNCPSSHGLNNAVDATSWKQMQSAKARVFSAIAAQLQGQLKLLDHLVPVTSSIVVSNKAYSTPITGLTTAVDQLGEKIFIKPRSTDSLIPYDQNVFKDSKW